MKRAISIKAACVAAFATMAILGANSVFADTILAQGSPSTANSNIPSLTNTNTPIIMNSTVFSAGNSNTPSAGNSNAPSVSNSGPQSTVMGGIPNPLNGVNSISDLIFKIIKVVVDLSYVVIAFFLLLSGFKFIAAQGSESKLEEAKKTFLYTIVGAFLIIGAQVIVSVIQGVFRSLN